MHGELKCGLMSTLEELSKTLFHAKFTIYTILFDQKWQICVHFAFKYLDFQIRNLKKKIDSSLSLCFKLQIKKKKTFFLLSSMVNLGLKYFYIMCCNSFFLVGSSKFRVLHSYLW